MDKRHEFMRKVEKAAERRRRARGKTGNELWFGFGMFGLVGWSVAVPTLLCTALGVWLDRTTQSQYSWTLMLLLIGVVIGCLNAWYWIRKEGHDHDK